MDRSDVLIIGGGIAGITTALELLDGGKSVALLDRDEEGVFGGLARESFGGMFFVDSPEQRRQGIRDSIDLAYRDWCSFAEFGDGDRWPRAWAEAYVSRCTEDVYKFVRGHGVTFLPVVNWVERGEFVPGNSVPRFHVSWGTGKGLAEALIAALRGHSNAGRLSLRFNARVDQLTMESGAVVGASGADEKTGAPFEVAANAVVIAAGGINGGDLSRVRANWHADWKTPPETILSGSHRFADGKLHDAAAEAGGVLTHLDNMWNYAAGVHHPKPRKPMHGLSLVPPRSALWLNWRGMRIGPQPLVSGFDTRRLVTDICAQEKQYSWQLMNMRIALKELAVSGAEHNPSIREKKRARVSARYPLWQSLAGARDDRPLPGFRHRELLARAGREDERAAGRSIGRAQDGAGRSRALRRHHCAGREVDERRAAPPHRVDAQIQRRPCALVQIPADHGRKGIAADRGP